MVVVVAVVAEVRVVGGFAAGYGQSWHGKVPTDGTGVLLPFVEVHLHLQFSAGQWSVSD